MHKTVLVVDDGFLIAMDLQLLLERHGWCVPGTAATVKEAFEFLARELPAWQFLTSPLGRFRNTAGRGSARAEHTVRIDKRYSSPELIGGEILAGARR